MKYLIYFLVIVVAGIVGYMAHPAIYKSFERKRPKIVVVTQTVPQPGNGQAGGAPVSPPKTPSAADLLREKLKGAPPPPPPDGGSTPTTTSTGSSTPAPEEDEFARKYPLPNFKPIEEITKDWTYIPSRAFPRKVHSKVDVDFVLATGKATSPKGTELLAMGMVEGMLILARSETDTLKAQVPLVSTDLKETMIDLYDKYKEKTKSRIMALRDKARYEKEHPAPPPPPEDERVKIAGKKPELNGDGQIQEMVDDINAKKVTEFKVSQITVWQPVDFVMDGGTGYWSCTVNVKMNTIFGEVDTDVTALISNGKVARWFYAGSKEPVQ
jgi:hypothetical protein